MNLFDFFRFACQACRTRFIPLGVIVAIALSGLGFAQISSARAASVEAGFRDFQWSGSGVTSSPTGEKPESKLWWNDGFWWGSLYSSTAKSYRIFRLNWSTQTWSDTGVSLDNRGLSKADTLWDAASQKLYVASHVFASAGGVPTSDSTQWCRLYRYSYDPVNKTYSLDAGFPVNVVPSVTETLTIAKDSTGVLWVTYVENTKVMVNRSLNSDLDWGTPFVLPFADAQNVNADDISSVIAFQGNKIGVMWSNQSDKKVHFAVHLDGDPYQFWQAEETALPGPNCSGSCADDHINLKSVQVDDSGRVFAAIKTSLSTANAPLIMLLVRRLNGNWDSYVYSTVADNQTRPMVLLDEEHNQLYMFAVGPDNVIYYKQTDMNNIQFTAGPGTPFLRSSLDPGLNNPSSTKQNLNSTTGLVVIASDGGTRYYLHNYFDLTTPAATSTPTNTSLPTTTPTSVNTPVVTSTPVITDTPAGTATQTSTPLPTLTATSTPLPTDTPLPTNTAAPTNTPVPLPDLIYANGFETGDLSLWTSSSTNNGNLSVSPAAALLGNFGLQANIASTTNMFVTDDTPTAERHYRARFYFDPNALVMSNGNSHFIFQGYTGSATVVLQVEIRYSKGQHQLRAKGINDAGTAFTTAWVAISDAPHPVEIEWQVADSSVATNGYLNFWVDGVMKGTISGLSNSTRVIDQVRIGSVNGLDSGTSGTYFFDTFESRRNTYIGP